MKILLINPEYPFEESPSPPYGLMALGAWLLEKGHEVKIEDYVISPYSKERVRSVIESFQPQVAGATGVTMNINKSLSVLRDYKELSPELVTVLGGPHASFDAENLLKNSFVDIIVRGEGELTFAEFLAALENKGSYNSIAGLSFKKDNTIIHNADRPFIEDINILPKPARHLVQLSKYKAANCPVNMITSRGCPFECIFCVGSKMVGRRVRFFETGRVVDEFEELSKLGFSQINIADDLFTSNKKRCMAICEEIIKRGIRHAWTAFARVDTVSPDLLAIMKEAGCTMLCFGIESGSQEILDRVKKKTNLATCKEAVALCKEAGIGAMTSYILGLPGETPDTVQETLEFARNLSPHFGYHILAPFPGTEVRDKKEEYGMRILTDDWDKYDANRSVAESIYMDHREVDRIVDDFYAKIDNYVRAVAGRYDAGDAKLTSEDRKMVEGLKQFVFSQSLLREELVENFPAGGNTSGASDNEELLNSFTDFLLEKTGVDRERISLEIGKLFSKDCLKIETRDGKLALVWV